MEKVKFNLKDPKDVIALIIVGLLLISIIIAVISHYFVAQRLKLNIYMKSTLAYDSFGLPGSIKSISISSDPSVSLGYGYDDGKLHFCIHGIKEVEREYIVGPYTRSHMLKIKSEIVFAKDELEEGATISGFSKIYVDDRYSYSGYYEFNIGISEVRSGAPRQDITTTHIFEEEYLTDYSAGVVEALATLHIREIFNAFHDFLEANDYKNIYKQYF